MRWRTPLTVKWRSLPFIMRKKRSKINSLVRLAVRPTTFLADLATAPSAEREMTFRSYRKKQFRSFEIELIREGRSRPASKTQFQNLTHSLAFTLCSYY